MKLTVATQNMTEGPVTDDLRACDIIILQEVDIKKVRAGFPSSKFGVFQPKRDKHQAIVWNKNVVHIGRKRGWVRFHKSGKAENFPFGTPARGMLWCKGYLVEDPSVKIVIFGIWFLNSWMPARSDQWTPIRRSIVEKRVLPIFKRMIARWTAKGFIVVGGGDANSITWSGRIPGMKQPWPRGLDRIWLSMKIRIKAKRDGAKTGVGNDMQHHAKIVDIEI